MPEPLRAGHLIDGFQVGECIHSGGTGFIYRVTAPPARDPGFPLVLKAPAVGRAQPTISIVTFEMEQMILPTLCGTHVPRFVAEGALTATPYLVMEWIDGEGLAAQVARAPFPADEVARVGAALADAVHNVHQQNVVHLDLNPENFILRQDGSAVLLDFGFAHHSHYPDLIAEEQHFAAGSAAYVSPEQLQRDRSDPRSDIFALGVLLYQLATGELPFGEPRTYGGMRDRVWREPLPPRAVNEHVPPWLQEIVLRCLHPNPAKRYQSAAHVAFDLRQPEQVALSYRALRTTGAGFFKQFGRWWRSRSQPASAQRARLPTADVAPVILVAVDTEHPDDARHPALLWTTRQILSLNQEFRVMCVSVIHAAALGEGRGVAETASGKHLEHKTRLKAWVAPLELPSSRLSLHVVESANPADTLLEMARANHVNLIVLGAPGPSQMKLAWWRSAASHVTANAPCSVHVVRVPEHRVTSG